MLPQTITVMKKLRELNKSLGNALKINEFVDTYIDDCALNGESVTIITPWSLSRSFKRRYLEQGNKFSPTNGEIRLFGKEIQRIESVFTENGFELNWWLVFSRSYIREFAISATQEKEYVAMISELIEMYDSKMVLIDWEDDVIGMKHQPNLDLLNEETFTKLVNQDDFNYEIGRRSERAKTILKINPENNKLIEETKFKIACEANEGLFLMQNRNNPLSRPGKFLFMILGKAERYSFFGTIVPEFKKRIVCALKPYPWRLNTTESKPIMCSRTHQFFLESEPEDFNYTAEEMNRFKRNEAFWNSDHPDAVRRRNHLDNKM